MNNNNLFSSFNIRGHEIKNRVVMPPLVNFGWADENGFINERHVRHYEDRAKGGVGLIIVEATCVKKDGRIIPSQPGIWSDDHIEGFKRITKACKAHGAVILLQIHHSGLITHASVTDQPKGPSLDPNMEKSRAFTNEEIHELKNDFIAAAKRASLAGFDGIELHGAHGYLLNQFASSFFNKREDEYGGSHEKRLKLACDIIRGIRETVGDDFIIGYRLGSNSPAFEDGKKNAVVLEKAGLDLLHVSHGGGTGIIPEVPVGFEYNWIVYSGTQIRKEVKTPVIVVNEIKTPQRASFLIENGMADFTAIGKDLLTDPLWVKKAMNNEKIEYCIACKPKCKRYESPELCPIELKKGK